MHSICQYMSLAYYRKPGREAGVLTCAANAYATPSYIKNNISLRHPKVNPLSSPFYAGIFQFGHPLTIPS